MFTISGKSTFSFWSWPARIAVGARFARRALKSSWADGTNWAGTTVVTWFTIFPGIAR